MIKHKNKIIFFLIAVGIIILGYFISANSFKPPKNFIPEREGFGFLNIFIRNFFSNILLLGLALLGPISLLACGYQLFSIGMGIYRIQILYSTTVSKALLGISVHGIGEIFVILLIMWISTKITFAWIRYLFKNEDGIVRKVYAHYYSYKIIRIVSLIAIVLMLSSFLEVYWSLPFFETLFNKK
ncbi:stage II sporulation protein M [Clostridium kluyveri]|uniref:Stage II sporulation protein M n=1 Tax=Clostridium kluyveri TaxID=1534 RepID=A0A1L5FCW6_CLOKL|nr:stage II sporulation protein M [Clostridium kluyveri]APM40817.1 hypothetical protein BS101_19940 [Clostridium kluyveri]